MDTLRNNIDGIMQATEGFSDQGHGQATSQKKQHITEQRLNATKPPLKTFEEAVLLWIALKGRYVLMLVKRF